MYLMIIETYKSYYKIQKERLSILIFVLAIEELIGELNFEYPYTLLLQLGHAVESRVPGTTGKLCFYLTRYSNIIFYNNELQFFFAVFPKNELEWERGSRRIVHHAGPMT